MAKTKTTQKTPPTAKMASLSMDGAVRVKLPPREKLHPLYSDPHAQISFLTTDHWVFRLHLHFLKKRSAFFSDTAEIATSTNTPSESMDVEIERYAMQQFAEYVYGDHHYPSRTKILTGKGNPEKMFKALATFEKLQDEKLVVRIKENIKVEYQRNTDKAAACMCLALASNRPEMAADAMKFIPATDGPGSKKAFDVADISAKTAAARYPLVPAAHNPPTGVQVHTWIPGRSRIVAFYKRVVSGQAESSSGGRALAVE